MRRKLAGSVLGIVVTLSVPWIIGLALAATAQLLVIR